ncbi:phosphatase PAP2 family protein [Pyxidicoccus sp. 3LG]
MRADIRGMRELLLRLNRHFAGRLATTVVILAGTFQCYWWLNAHLPPRFDLSLPVDAAIPFLPWTYVVYTSFFVFPLVAAWALEADEYVRMLGAVLVVNALCYLGFFLFTSHFPRPPVESIASLYWREQFRLMWSQDLPGNTFPSLHVAVTVLGALRLRHRRGGVLWIAWAALISLSTLTVKQHFVVDVVGGAAVALAAHAAFFRRWPVAVVPASGRGTPVTP